MFGQEARRGEKENMTPEEYYKLLEFEERAMKAKIDIEKSEVDPMEIKALVDSFLKHEYLEELFGRPNYNLKIDVRMILTHFDLYAAILEGSAIDYERLSKLMNLSQGTIKIKIREALYDSKVISPPITILKQEIGRLRIQRKRKQEVEKHQEGEKIYKDILGGLTRREVVILCLKNGLMGFPKMTYEEIGKKRGFKVTRERIRQIEGKALRKLKHPSRENHPLRKLLFGE